MADVFISCARLDQDRIKPLVERLSSLGYGLYQHADLRTPADEIEQKLDAAQTVIIVWSENSRNSSWMLALGMHALDADKLIQVRLDAGAPPPPFDALPAHDMIGERVEWSAFEHAVAKPGRSVALPPRARSAGFMATSSVAGAPKLLTIALAAVLTAFAGAVPAAANGLMAPDQLQIALMGMLGVSGVCATLAAYRLFAIARAET